MKDLTEEKRQQKENLIAVTDIYFEQFIMLNTIKDTYYRTIQADCPACKTSTDKVKQIMKKFKELPSEHRAQQTVSKLNATIKEQGDDLKLIDQTLKAREAQIKRLEDGYDGELKKLKEELKTLQDDYNELQDKFLFQGGSLEESKKQVEEQREEIVKLTQ